MQRKGTVTSQSVVDVERMAMNRRYRRPLGSSRGSGEYGALNWCAVGSNSKPLMTARLDPLDDLQADTTHCTLERLIVFIGKRFVSAMLWQSLGCDLVLTTPSHMALWLDRFLPHGTQMATTRSQQQVSFTSWRKMVIEQSCRMTEVLIEGKVKCISSPEIAQSVEPGKQTEILRNDSSRCIGRTSMNRKSLRL